MRAPHPDHARQEPGIAAIGRQTQRAIAECKSRIVGRHDNVGNVEQAQSAATGTAAHRGDNRRVDAGQPFDRQMIAIDHAAQAVRQLLARRSRKQAEVAADGEVRTIAGDQDGADV